MAEFHQLAEMGWFEDQRAMLIDGVILEQGPMNPPHATAVTLASDVLRAFFAIGHHVRTQLPLLITGSSI